MLGEGYKGKTYEVRIYIYKETPQVVEIKSTNYS